MSGSRLRPYLGPVVALLVVLALGAGTVYAAIPNGNGKVYACYVKNTGAVRLINYPKVSTCPKGQKLISWNAQGPQGPAGAQGPEGDQGPKGDPGPAGASGSSNWGDIANKPADLADGQIGWGEVANKPADLADGQVGWGEVANKPADLADGAVGWGEVASKPAGFADGVDNEGVTTVKLTTKLSSGVSVPAGEWGTVIVDCPAGSKVTGGGPYSTSKFLHTTDSYPSNAGTRWVAWGHNTDSVANTLSVYAICMSVEPSGAITVANKGVKPAKLRKHK